MKLYPHLLRGVVLPLMAMVKGKPLLKYVNEYNRHLNLSSEEIQHLQWQALTRLLKHSFENCPYYRERWQTVGVDDIRTVDTMAQFQQLPVLTKDDIRQHYQRIRAKNFDHNIVKATGGSTGQPLTFELDFSSNTRREAVMWRGYGWLGAGLGERTLYLWGSGIGRPAIIGQVKEQLYHWLYNRKMLNSFTMSPDNMHWYIKQINAYRASAMVAYVNPLYELAKYIVQHQLEVHKPQSILTGAEPLYQYQRAVIEQAFQCPVYNTYGCREVMLVAAECQQEKQLHINSDHVLVETINDEGQVVSECSGDVLLTDLYNYAMPLIRYQNGDRATLLDNACACGNPLPLMSSVDGRKLDVIKTASGKLIPGELFPHLFKEFTSIDKFQVKQTQIDALTISIVAKNGLPSADKLAISNEINRYSCGELLLNFQLVDDIPLTSSGKYRVTICEV
jgi:phenylacetate-CoA ligase